MKTLHHHRFNRSLLAALILFFLLIIGSGLFSVPTSLAAAPSFSDNGTKLIFSNGFIYLEFNKSNPCIDTLKADFGGGGTYGVNLLAVNTDGRQGIVLETVNSAGTLNKSSKSNSAASYSVLQNDLNAVKVRITGIKDAASGNIATSTWTITLNADSRKFTLESTTTVAVSQSIKAIKISAYLSQWFMNGFYSQGVVQYINNGTTFFSSTSPLQAFYSMDNSYGSLAVVPVSVPGVVESNMVSDSSVFKTGLEQVMAGSYPTKNTWNSTGWGAASNVNVTAGVSYTANYDIFPNNYAFPTHTLKAGPNMDFNNLRAFYTAVYGSAAGVLGSYSRSGSAYPTLATPGRAYGDTYTYFDPDSWSTVATLSFSGDTYLQNEARKILELSENNMKPDGQIPHHFESGSPTYLALSGASQTGPNIFWLLAAIDYVTATGNTSWLTGHYNNLKKGTDWLLGYYDSGRKLLKVNGPLFIDVFIRNNYTLDTNAFMLRLLPLMAGIAGYCGDSSSAATYNQRALDIKDGINSGLWNGDNHYITQRNADWTVRDKVDYDANYAVIAFKGTTDPVRISAMYSRLDGGAHTHPGGKGTWPSEIYYGSGDCYNGNTGDSSVAMARIWWVDMFARYVTGDLTNFNTYYSNIRNDLFNGAWMTERYDSGGNLVRASYYHEYPEIVSMILREMIYGIDIKIDTVTIKPFGTSSYDFNVGSLAVSYAKSSVSMTIPGSGTRTYKVYGLDPNTIYTISAGGSVTTDSNGVATFTAAVGSPITISNGKPGGFSLISPANNATGLSLTPTLTWGASTAATGYDLTIKQDSTTVVSRTNLTGTSYNVITSDGLTSSTTYTWYVTAKNGSGTTNASNNGISFSTQQVLNSPYTKVNLNGAYNQDGMSYDTARSDGNLDGAGNTYSADLLPGTITAGGVDFNLGPETNGVLNVVTAAGQAIALPVGNASSVKILAAATNGNKSGSFTVNYSDATGTSVNLSVTDWCAASPAFGETVANTCAHRHTPTADDPNATKIYLYNITTDTGKTVSSITLPNEQNLKLMAMTVVSAGASPTPTPAGTATPTPAPTSTGAVTATPTPTPGGSLPANPSGEVLKLDVTNNSITPHYYYQKFSTTAYTFQSGDYLEYDVKILNNVDGAGGMEIVATDNSYFRDITGWQDQNALRGHPAEGISTRAYNTWYHRKLAVPGGMVGKTSGRWDVVGECETAGLIYTALYDNIVITNGSGVERKVIFKTGSDSNANAADVWVSNASASMSVINIDATSTPTSTPTPAPTSTPTPASTTAPVKVNLTSYFNHDGFSYDSNRGDGNYDNGTDAYSKYSADLVNVNPSYDGVSYQLGPITDGSNNSIKGTSQTITLPQGVYSSIRLLGSATNQDKTGTFRINYTDSTYSDVSVTQKDWCGSNTAGEKIVQTMGHRHRATADQTINCYVFAYYLTPTAGKTVASLVLPNNADIHVLAITLVP